MAEGAGAEAAMNVEEVGAILVKAGVDGVEEAEATCAETVEVEDVKGVNEWHGLDCPISTVFLSAAKIWRKGSALSSSETSWGFPAPMTCTVWASFSTFSTQAEGA